MLYTFLEKNDLIKLIIKYSVPSIFSMWIYSLYIMIDGIFIGKFLGANEIAAVNIVLPYINASFALGIMVAIGGGTIISIRLGEKRKKEANRIYSLSLQTFIILGGILGFFGIFFTKQIVKFLGANSIISNSAEKYLFVISFFTLFYLLSYGLSIFTRIDGNPIYSMVCDFTGAFINIFLDYLLIIHYKLGITGAAIATGTAQFGTALALGLYLAFKSKKLKFNFTKFILKDIKTICFNGSSEFLTEIATGIVIIAFNINIIKTIGEKGVSAFAIIGYISIIVTMTMIGFSQGLQPIISYYFGAKNYTYIIRILKIALNTATTLGIIFYLGINLFTENIISFFAKVDSKLFLITKEAIKIYSFTYILMGINIIISAYFTAIEDALISAILSILRGIIFINILLYLLPIVFNDKGIWLSAPINEILTLLISLSLLFSNGKRKLKYKKTEP